MKVIFASYQNKYADEAEAYFYLILRNVSFKKMLTVY